MGHHACVVLLSGGLDSATVLALARAQNRVVHAISFSYGQKHAVELDFAARQATAQGVASHRTVNLGSLAQLVASKTALVDGSELSIPKDGPGLEIPVTYVPARNAVFLSCALAWAESLDAAEIWIGVNALDYSGYPDCRPAFIEAFQHMANLGTRAGVESGDTPAIVIRAPLIDLHKHEIIRLGNDHGLNYGATLSCYDPIVRDGNALACGACDSCRLRRDGFLRSGVADPTAYA